MSDPLRLMAVLAHPDDESLGFGGTLARYAREGVETSVVTATRGQGGRFRGHPQGSPEHPGPEALGVIREAELRAAARTLGIHRLTVLDYHDQQLDRAEPRAAIAAIVREIRTARPQVVLTFAGDGAYGHPDHIAISQLACGAAVAAADPAFTLDGEVRATDTHAVSKFYFIAWPAPAMAAYESAFRRMISVVDGVEREATPWPEWAINCVIDTRAVWETVWSAVSCHESQITAYEKLKHLSPEHHEALWSWQSYYRVFSLVNGGRVREHDLFEGIRT